MDFGKGLPRFLSWLEWARGNTPAPPIVPLREADRNPEGIVTDREAEEFLYFGLKIQTPQSSNVAWMEYFPDKEKLHVGFNNTYVYEYLGITVELAYDFYIAVSKGRWVWDNLRTVRRPYQFLYSLNGRTPVRMEDPAATSVKAALGSLSILGIDPFSRTKSARRIKKRYALLRKGLGTGGPSLQFSPVGRHRTGRQRIKALNIRSK